MLSRTSDFVYEYFISVLFSLLTPHSSNNGLAVILAATVAAFVTFAALGRCILRGDVLDVDELCALEHLLDALVGRGIGGHLGLEDDAQAADVLSGAVLVLGLRSLRADAHLEASEVVDLHALGVLQAVGDHLHHLGEHCLGIRLLGSGVPLDALGDVVEVNGAGHHRACIPLLECCDHVVVHVLNQSVKNHIKLARAVWLSCHLSALPLLTVQRYNNKIWGCRLWSVTVGYSRLFFH